MIKEKTTRKNVPEVRFEGFEGEWEESFLGEHSNITTGKLDANAMKEDGLYDFYTSGIKKFKIDIPAFEGPAITIAGNGATVGYMHLADGLFNAYQRTYVLTNFTDNRKFLFYEIGNKLPRKISEEARTGNIPYIVLDMLSKLVINTPSLPEQSQIGTLFQQLDNQISHHRTKLQKLQHIKQAMLTKMFPQNGAKVPEVRFEGFEGDWERKKLREIAERIVRKNEGLRSTLPLTISAQHGLVDQYTYFNNRVASKNVEGYYLIEKGEFAYNKSYSDGYPWGAVKRLDKYDNGVLSTLYIVFNIKDVDSDFIVSFFETSIWHNDVAKRAAEGARNHGLLNISPNDFFDIPIVVPISLEEQSQIGSFFQQLDTLLAHHQKQLDKLGQIKSALLDKLFV